jgi:peptidoglycan hydrolase-like protein with peptidoglycan-binding domain
MAPPTVAERRVMRHTQESNFVNTINAADRLQIHFVWFPGPHGLAASLIDTLIVAPDGAGHERNIEYRWQPEGLAEVRRKMLSGTVTLLLPPGRKGKLTAFDTTWEITRAANGVTLDPAASMRGVQQRLDRLGYHLRSPGQKSAGLDGIEGPITEAAVIAFQADFRPAAVGAGRLRIRGEWTSNPVLTPLLDANNSAADGTATRTALVAAAGA